MRVLRRHGVLEAWNARYPQERPAVSDGAAVNDRDPAAGISKQWAFGAVDTERYDRLAWQVLQAIPG